MVDNRFGYHIRRCGGIENDELRIDGVRGSFECFLDLQQIGFATRFNTVKRFLGEPVVEGFGCQFQQKDNVGIDRFP